MGDVNEILEILTDISKRLSNVATKDDLRELSHRVDNVEHETDVFINGNGKEGAKVRLDRLERDLESLRVEIKCIADAVVSRITMRLIKTVGVPLGIAFLIWVAGVIYNASITAK